MVLHNQSSPSRLPHVLGLKSLFILYHYIYYGLILNVVNIYVEFLKTHIFKIFIT